MTAKTALILGANGRFGQAALQAFTAAGWQTTALVRAGKTASHPRVIHADASDAEALTRAAEGFDVIVNALNPPYDKWPALIPPLTRAIIAAARASGASVVIPGNVYNFGPNMPPLLTTETPQRATQGKGLIRRQMEDAYRAADIPVILLRAGDYIGAGQHGQWFDGLIANKVAKGVFTYPGDYNIVHAWAYLPDMARAAVALCEIRDTLPRFADIPFAGYGITGEELARAIETAGERPLKRKRTPWAVLHALALFMPVMQEVIAMRYLWDTPHRLDPEPLRALLPDFRPTPLETAMKEVLFT